MAYAAIPHPWSSVTAAVKWANSEFQVAITPWVFCQLATVLWGEDPVTHTPLPIEEATPWEVLTIPYPVLEALAMQNYIPWPTVERLEDMQCKQQGLASVNTAIALPWRDLE